MRNPAPNRRKTEDRAAKLDAAPIAGQGQTDPVLIELAKFLARAAAERDYEEHIRNKREALPAKHPRGRGDDCRG